jgi:hypothetical protein
MKIKTGPNVKRLIAAKIAREAIPADGKFADGIEFLLNPDRVRKTARQATIWAAASIEAVRNAPGPNPFKNASDEEIAGVILKEMEKRKRKV